MGLLSSRAPWFVVPYIYLLLTSYTRYKVFCSLVFLRWLRYVIGIHPTAMLDRTLLLPNESVAVLVFKM